MWLEDMFGTKKPIIATVHLKAFPTDPKYDPEGGIDKIYYDAKKDIEAYQNGGVDGLLFCNEYSIPYTKNVNSAVIASYAAVVGRLLDVIKVPFGIACAFTEKGVFDVATATGAKFVRSHHHGANAGVYGINDYDPGDIERYKHYVGCGDVKWFTAVNQEGTKQIAERPVEDVVKTLTFNLAPDGLLIYSSTPGSSIDIDLLKKVKSVTDTPVLASNGVKIETVKEVLTYSDGCIVATGLKYDGNFYNPVDPDRVKALVANANVVRGK